MKILKTEQFITEKLGIKPITKKRLARIKNPYSEIFISKADQYQTAYDLTFLRYACSPQRYDEAGELYDKIRKHIQNEKFPIYYEVFLDGREHAEKCPTLNGDYIVNSIFKLMLKYLKEENDGAFKEIKMDARCMLLGMFNGKSSYEQNDGDYYVGKEHRGIETAEPLIGNNNKLTYGIKETYEWLEYIKNKIEEIIKGNNAELMAYISVKKPKKVVIRHLPPNEMDVILSIEHIGCDEFYVNNQNNNSKYMKKDELIEYLKKALI